MAAETPAGSIHGTSNQQCLYLVVLFLLTILSMCRGLSAVSVLMRSSFSWHYRLPHVLMQAQALLSSLSPRDGHPTCDQNHNKLLLVYAFPVTPSLSLFLPPSGHLPPSLLCSTDKKCSQRNGSSTSSFSPPPLPPLSSFVSSLFASFFSSFYLMEALTGLPSPALSFALTLPSSLPSSSRHSNCNQRTGSFHLPLPPLLSICIALHFQGGHHRCRKGIECYHITHSSFPQVFPLIFRLFNSMLIRSPASCSPSLSPTSKQKDG